MRMCAPLHDYIANAADLLLLELHECSLNWTDDADNPVAIST